MTAILIISILLFTGYAALLLFYRQSWLSAPYQPPALATAAGPRISVIIPARNEAAHIGACLDSLRRQSYPADRRNSNFVPSLSDPTAHFGTTARRPC